MDQGKPARYERLHRPLGLMRAFAPALLRATATAAGVALVALFDYGTGEEIGARSLYILPVLYAAWHLGLWPASLAACTGMGLWLHLDLILHESEYRQPLAPYVDAALASGALIVAAYLAVRLKRSLAEARELVQLKSELLSMASHEFGNSLTILNASSAILDARFGRDAEAREWFDMLNRAQLNLKAANENFLNHARLESGRFQLDLKRFDVAPMIGEYLQVAAPLIRSSRLVVDLESAAPDTRVWADPSAIRVVVVNLINNAIKYTPEGGKIAIKLLPAAAGVELRVEDTGIGIGEEDLARIFSGFYRTRSGREAAKGFGVGLKVSREIVRSHGYDLSVESAPGRGSRFSFTLPLERPAFDEL